MSDLMIAALIAVPLVLGTIAALGYSLHRSDKRDVQELLPKVKCVCGHSPLTWNGGVWLLEGHVYPPNDDSPHPKEDTACFDSGYVFDCPACHRSLSFTRDGRLHRTEEDAEHNCAD